MSQKSDVWIIAKESRKNFGENMQTEGVDILKAATLLDYVIYISLPPKQSVSKAVSRK